MNRPMPIRAVFFDLFHTLVDVDAAPGEPTSAILGVDPEAWIRKVFEHSPHHALGEIADPYESLRRIAHSIDPAVPEDRIRKAVRVRRSRFRHAIMNPPAETLDLLRSVRFLDLMIGLISNASLDEVEAWPDSKLAPFFDGVFFSCREKLMKPDPRIFDHAAAALGVETARSVFVGDGGSREHEGARAAGMRTILFLELLQRTAPDRARERDREVDWIIASSNELASLLRSLALSS